MPPSSSPLAYLIVPAHDGRRNRGQEGEPATRPLPQALDALSVVGLVLSVLVARRLIGIDEAGAGEQVHPKFGADDESAGPRGVVVQRHRDDRSFETVGEQLREARRREDGGAEVERVAGAKCARRKRKRERGRRPRVTSRCRASRPSPHRC